MKLGLSKIYNIRLHFQYVYGRAHFPHYKKRKNDNRLFLKLLACLNIIKTMDL